MCILSREGGGGCVGNSASSLRKTQFKHIYKLNKCPTNVGRRDKNIDGFERKKKCTFFY